MPFAGWKHVALRNWREAGDDDVGVRYGLLADPRTVVRNILGLTSVTSADAAKLFGGQLMNVVRTSGTTKGLGGLDKDEPGTSQRQR